MYLNIENLGKVSVTPEGWWSKNKDYDRLCLVTDVGDLNQLRSYVSKKPVPAGKSLSDENYWMPISSIWLNVISKKWLDDLFDDAILIPTEEWAIIEEIEKESNDQRHCECCTQISIEKIDKILEDE